MLRTTLGQILINNALPPDMRNYDRVLDKKSMAALGTELAQKHPDKYRDVMQRLHMIARDSATATNGLSFSLNDLKTPPSVLANRHELRTKLRSIMANRELSPLQRNLRILKLNSEIQERMVEGAFKDAEGQDNPLARQVLSGGGGSKATLNSIIGSDVQYVDHKNDPIPIPVLRSYSNGLSPAEYFAASFGARKGVLDTKSATADSGFFCLDSTTEVRMADFSTKRISDIKIGDAVLGADRYGYTFPTRVTAVFDNGVRDVWRYKFRYGKSRTRQLQILATEQHRVLSRFRHNKIRRHKRPERIVRTEMCALGDMVNKCEKRHSLVAPRGFQNGRGKPEPWAWLIGLLLGDGGLTGGSVMLSSGDPVLIDELCEYLAHHDFALTPVKNHPYEYTISDNKPTLVYRYGQNRRVSRLWQRLEALGLRGHKASDKFIPQEVWTWDNESIAALIRGLIASDGSVNEVNNSSTPSITLGMTAESLVDDVADLLAMRFGIYAQLYTARCKGARVCAVVGCDSVSNHNARTLCINDRESVCKFAKLIGCEGVRGQKMTELVAGIAPSGRLDGFAFHFLSKEFVGRRATFDLEVAHYDHLFVLANGAIVSNSKQLNQVAHRLLVTATDDDEDETPGEPNYDRGYPTDVDDADNEGALLARPIGPYKRNTVLTPKILKDIKGMGVKDILVRSPLVGGPSDGGVYARDVGYREKGRLAPVGDYVGLSAAQAMGEPLSQGMLNSKHTGGVAKGGSQAASGFKAINALLQVPKKYPDGATHAQLDGKVTGVRPAPQGGHYVMVGDKEHYVPIDVDVSVKPGDHVEAGDVLSFGVPNPAEIVRHKGIGEGRRYFTQAMRDVYKNTGLTTHRRNVELIARGLINHVRLTDEYGDYGPDDVVPYSMLERSWTPRPGAVLTNPKSAVGQYLEKPVLHYSIGTKIGKGVVENLARYGITNVQAHKEPPPFEPEMVRGMANIGQDPDWMTKMLGSYQKTNLLSAAQRGATSDTAGSSFVPGLARGEDFGVKGPTAGWKPQSIIGS